MTRTSDDFYPEIPSSHGQHIFKNAVNSLFTRDITYCDWDMFMTCHDYGAYHAAARAVSGGPVYVTDKIGEHDFNVISALRMSDGTVPLCCDIAVPSPDCLMTDPTVSDKAYMLINRNKFGSVCGAFNLNAEGKVVSGDVDGIYYSFMKQGIVAGGFELAERGFDIFTKADIKDGFGVFGLTRFYNMGGTVKDFRVIDGFAYIELADVGEVALFCETEPSAVLCGDEAVDFTYDGGVVKFAADNHEIIIKK